ncbi:MAG: DUF6048 family protein [Paludibacteraceae bacterium]|nr:DUF6048 family protein [Paludibacteraceae bacterium]
MLKLRWRLHSLLLLVGLMMASNILADNDSTTIVPDTIAHRHEIDTIAHRHKDGTRIYPDSSIYQGMSLKLDIASPIIDIATSKGAIQTYEIGMNWRLKQRYYPVFELGYNQAQGAADEGTYRSQGGFARAGVDINGLKKHPERLNALLVGVRIATALQGYDLYSVQLPAAKDAEPLPKQDYLQQFRCDAWGEVALGCQVQVWEGFQMGWSFRLKVLMTRNAKEGEPKPYYIPGFGNRDDIGWGFHYYLGWMF